VALSQTDLLDPPENESVFFDVLGRGMVRWPAARTPAITMGIAVVLFVQMGWMIGIKRMLPNEFAWGLIAWLLTLAATGGLAVALGIGMRLAGATPVNWVAHPAPLEIAFWFFAIAIVIASGIFFAGRAGFWGLWSGVWTWWTLVALVVSWQSPGLSYLLVVPAGVAALSGLPFTWRRTGHRAGPSPPVLLPLATAAILGFVPMILLYQGFGTQGLPAIALAVAFLLSPVLPLCADLRGAPGLRGVALPWLPIVITALAVFAAIVAPVYSAKAPERVNIDYWQDADSGNSEWIVEPDSGRLSEPIRLAAPFRRADPGAFPWDPRAAFVADAPHLDLAPPTFTILAAGEAEGRRIYTALLRSERGAPFAAILFPPGAGVESVRMGGERLEPESVRWRQEFKGWSVYACPAIPAGGVEISFTVPVGKPIEVVASDQSYGLPPEGAFLLKSRPLTATASDLGDLTIVTRRVQLLP
jgi:hypothetical protein